LKEYSQEHQVDVLAYCLMTNHIHLVAVPNTEEGLNRMLKPLHMRYAQRINGEKGWKGPLWQGRYSSSPLDEVYLWAAIRYVERNPVRANMVRIAARYSWSSAAAHGGLRDDSVLTQKLKRGKQFDQMANWSAWLAEGEGANQFGKLIARVRFERPPSRLIIALTNSISSLFKTAKTTRVSFGRL
jgi:putative transposase